MPHYSTLERKVLQTITAKLIPWVDSGAPIALLSIPPTQIGTNIITEREGSELPLQKGRAGKRVHAQFWRDENLNALSVPYMGCVLEGEADITLGTTTAMCRKFNIPGKRWILQARQHTFFMTPPHYPISSGGGVHWERPHPETAYSQIFWMQFYPTGVQCHFCSCENGNHWSHPSCFVAGAETFGAAKKVIEEMTTQSTRYLPLVYLHLSVLLNLILRDMETRDTSQTIHQPHMLARSDSSLQAAFDYIETKLNQRLLTVEDIAAQMQYSPQHFARIFKKETGKTVMEYVYERRMEMAARLLDESTFSVQKVARGCGYVSATPFIKAFKRHFHKTPAEYRAEDNIRFG